MRCRYKYHGDAHDFPDDEFRFRDGRWIHEVPPRHTVDGDPVISTTDATDRDERRGADEDRAQ